MIKSLTYISAHKENYFEPIVLGTTKKHTPNIVLLTNFSDILVRSIFVRIVLLNSIVWGSPISIIAKVNSLNDLSMNRTSKRTKNAINSTKSDTDNAKPSLNIPLALSKGSGGLIMLYSNPFLKSKQNSVSSSLATT